MTAEELENELTKIQARTADILGELDHAGKAANPYSNSEHPHVSETRTAALSAQLQHFEQKRHHLMLEHAQKGLTDAASNCETLLAHILEERVAEAQARHNPDHTYIHAKGLGIHIEASGNENDPNFQRVQKTVEEIGAIITATKRAFISAQTEESAKDNELDRELRRKEAEMFFEEEKPEFPQPGDL